jgi:hypothetical protein
MKKYISFFYLKGPKYTFAISYNQYIGPDNNNKHNNYMMFN